MVSKPGVLRKIQAVSRDCMMKLSSLRLCAFNVCETTSIRALEKGGSVKKLTQSTPSCNRGAVELCPSVDSIERVVWVKLDCRGFGHSRASPQGPGRVTGMGCTLRKLRSTTLRAHGRVASTRSGRPGTGGAGLSERTLGASCAVAK